MFKLSLAVVLLAGLATAYPTNNNANIKGYGLVSPINAHRSAVAGPVRSAPPPSYQPQGGKGGSKSYVQTNYQPRPPVKIGPVSAAVITSRAQEVINVPISEDVITPQVVIIEPNISPVTIEFRSRSSPVNIQQVHIPGPRGQIKTTRSEEQPDKVIHEVLKPVVQEVREIIQPIRKVTQQILPVQEEVLSVVSKGERKQRLEEVEVPKVEIPEVKEPEVQQEEQVQAESAPTSSYHGAGTIVQAGIIGGARIMPAPEDGAALLGSVNNQPRGRKVAA